MTTIAVTRTQIAGDRQANHNGGLKFRLKTKIHSFENVIFYPKPFHVGLCGDVDQFATILNFFDNPTAYKKPPKFSGGEGIILTGDGKIWTFWQADTWTLVDQAFYAVGSGMNFAMGVMAAGGTAAEAVKYASTLDSNTGMGITKVDI